MFDLRVPYILAAWALLLTFSAVMVGSSAIALSDNYLTKHLVYLSLALVAFAICYAMPPKLWNMTYLGGWILALAISIAVLVPGLGHEVNGASRWLNFGGFTVQAAELAKFGLCLFLAGYLSRHGHRLAEEPQTLLIPLALVAVIAVLLVLEPDLGSAVVIMAASVGLLFVAGAKLRYFVLSALIGVGLFALLVWIEPYRLERFIAFLDPWEVQYGSGYQLTQALIAFGRGELWGLGLGEGIQKLYYLPEAHTDFIFAVIAEELGSIGALALTILLGFLILQLLSLAKDTLAAGHLFTGYAAYFFGLLVACQVLVSLGVNTGMLPTKGLTLPFVSYGGNSVIVFCALLGLILRGATEAQQASPRAKSRRAKSRGAKRG